MIDVEDLRINFTCKTFLAIFCFTCSYDVLSEIHDQFTRTRAERVREVLFPETMPDDGTVVPSPQYDPNVSTSVQRLAQPSRMLKNAVVSLIHYQVSCSGDRF